MKSLIVWKPFSAVTTAVAALVLGVMLQYRHNTELAAARTQTKHAVEIASYALQITDEALAVADSLGRYADSVENVARDQAQQAAIATNWAQHLAAVADSAAAVAPDTCGPALAAMTASRDAEHASAVNWRLAYENQAEASAALRTAGDTLANTTRDLSNATSALVVQSTELVKASGPSFWSHLKPDVVVSAGVQRGVDVRDGTVHTTVGGQVGLGWRIPL